MRVLVTRPLDQAASFAEALRAAQYEPVFLPAIAIRPVDDPTALDRALMHLDRYHWLVLTSANAVDVLAARMDALGIKKLPEMLQIAAIGPKTTAQLGNFGLRPDFIPDRYISEAIVSGLGDLTDRWVLLPTADLAGDDLPCAVEMAGGIAHVIIAYHTVPAQPDPEGLAALQSGLGWITFTSGSTAKNFYALAQGYGLDPLNLPGNPKIACIGPKTASVAEDLGFNVDIVADPHTTDGLAAAIYSYNGYKTHD